MTTTSGCIYFAAGLFSGREVIFNLTLTHILERRNYRVLLPQRDGFEFSELRRYLQPLLQESQVGEAVQTIIYLLDMGIFLPMSTVVVATLDEPLDEGVVVEVSYARLMGKFVVGIRTDTRSPFGSSQTRLGGIHFFPAFQCDAFIRHPMSGASRKDSIRELKALALAVHEAITSQAPRSGGAIPTNLVPSRLTAIRSAAQLLFNGDIAALKSDAGMRQIAENYCRHRQALEFVHPNVRPAYK